MVKSLLAGILAVPLVLAFTLAPAGAFPRHAGVAQLKADLGLSDEQVQAIRQLHAGQREQRVQLHASLRQARQSLRELILANGSESDIQARTAEVQQLLGQTVQLRVQTLQGVAHILTAEQREKLAQLRPTWHRRSL